MNSISGYFDYASATPISDEALEAMQPFYSKDFYNPSSLYNPAKAVREKLHSCRVKVADVIGVKPQEIIFTAGCTEANNIALQGVLNANPGGKVLVSAIEHDSVLRVLDMFPGSTIGVDTSGILDLKQLESSLDDDVVLVSVIYASNEIGTVQPLREIAAVLESERKKRGPKGRPLYFHTDAAQAGNYLNFKARSLGVQLMSINGGKIYGPKASGCLFVGSEVKIDPLFFGGSQESGLRSGTENVPAIAGFAKSLAATATLANDESTRVEALRDQLIEKLQDLGGTLNGSIKHRLPNNINVCFDGIDNEVLVMQLDEAGFQVASGSACHASSGKVSQVLKAIGLSDARARSSIRISLGRFTTEQDVDGLVRALRSLLAK